MIFITNRYCQFTEGTNINNVWEVNSNNPEQDYKNFMISAAKENFQIEINPHWLNMMNHKDHHPHLSSREYLKLLSLWEKYSKLWTIETYLEKVLHANKVEYLISVF